MAYLYDTHHTSNSASIRQAEGRALRRNIHTGTALAMGMMLLAGCATDPESESDTTQPSPDVAEAPTTPEPTEAVTVANQFGHCRRPHLRLRRRLQLVARSLSFQPQQEKSLTPPRRQVSRRIFSQDFAWMAATALFSLRMCCNGAQAEIRRDAAGSASDFCSSGYQWSGKMHRVPT